MAQEGSTSQEAFPKLVRVLVELARYVSLDRTISGMPRRIGRVSDSDWAARVLTPASRIKRG